MRYNFSEKEYAVFCQRVFVGDFAGTLKAVNEVLLADINRECVTSSIQDSGTVVYFFYIIEVCWLIKYWV